MKQIIKLFLGLAIWPNIYAHTKNCINQSSGFEQQLGLKYIKHNIYREPSLLTLDFSKQPAYLADKSLYQDYTRKYRTALKRALFPDLCIRWINSTVKYGLFANENITKGQLIGEYVGEVVFFEKMKNTDFAFDFPIKVQIAGQTKSVSIDARIYGNELRFTNHSDDPNVVTHYILVDDKFSLIFVASKNIKAGQQLFINYGQPYWSGTRQKIKLEA